MTPDESWALIVSTFCFLWATFMLLIKGHMRDLLVRLSAKTNNRFLIIYLKHHERAVVPGLRLGAILFYIVGIVVIVVTILKHVGILKHGIQ